MAAEKEELMPLTPIHTEDQSLYASDWPITNLRLQEAERAAKMFAHKENTAQGSEQQFFDSDAFGSSNAAMSNILKDEPKQEVQKAPVATAQIPEDTHWVGSEDEISLGDDDMEDTQAQPTGVVTEAAQISIEPE